MKKMLRMFIVSFFCRFQMFTEDCYVLQARWSPIYGSHAQQRAPARGRLMETLIQVSFGEENQRLRFPWPWILIPHTNLFVKQAQIIKSTNVNIEHGEFQRCFFVICVSQYKSFPYFSYSPSSKKKSKRNGNFRWKCQIKNTNRYFFSCRDS